MGQGDRDGAVQTWGRRGRGTEEGGWGEGEGREGEWGRVIGREGRKGGEGERGGEETEGGSIMLV